MPINPEPVFFRTLKKNAGAKRKLITVTNTEDADFEQTIADVEKPEWVELEAVQKGVKLAFKKGRKTPVIVNINTNHKFFRKGESESAEIKIKFDDERELRIAVTIQEIIDQVEYFRGVFAMDFGTSNTCYAWKSKGDAMDADAAFKPAQSSEQIPTLIFFKDVSSSDRPKAVIGNEARHDIKEFGSQTYSYFMSIKRLLGEDKKFIVLDQHSGADPTHRQEWNEEQISSFIVREIIRRAEQKIGGKVTQVVATFPILYSQDRKNALRRMMENALKSMDVEVKDDSVVIDLDETNAAAFNYIYGPMLDEFRRFQSTDKKCTLLSFDFGGGTIDVSLIDVSIHVEDNVKIVIETKVKGLTGDLYYGGDNVTLEALKILKRRLALKIASVRSEKTEAETAATAAKSDDPWGASGEEAEEDVWGAASAEEEKPDEDKAAVKAEDEDPETMDIINIEDQEKIQNAIDILVREKEIVQGSIERGQTIFDTVEAKERDDGQYLGADQTRRRANEIEEAIETLIPTRYAVYEDEDPMKSDLARKLFMELWHEAETMKIRVSNSKSGEEKVASILKKIAKYASIDPIRLNEVSMKQAEVDAFIGPKIEQNVNRAYNLFLSTQAARTGGIVFADSVSEEEKELKVLMAGNASNLAIVRDKIKSTFNLDDNNLLFNRGTLKTSVAQGACEEYSLKKDFGESGLISYRTTGFLDKVPYSVGFFHPEFQRLGFASGFCPVFPRGTDVGASVVIGSDENFLIHKKLRELQIYADYMDGASPMSLGYFDFTKDGEACEPSAEDAQAPQDNIHRLRFHLLPDRSLKVEVPSKKMTYKLVPTVVKVKAEENPFSGVH